MDAVLADNSGIHCSTMLHRSHPVATNADRLAEWPAPSPMSATLRGRHGFATAEICQPGRRAPMYGMVSMRDIRTGTPAREAWTIRLLPTYMPTWCRSL